MREQAGRDFPQDPREQLDLAIRAVFDSWNGDRAVLYRRQERIPADLGTAVNVVAMVFGNLGDDSGTGVAFTRDPATGARGVYGDYLQNAQGEDVVAGIRNTVPLQDLERIDKASYDELMSIMATLEGHYRDLCDIEFTIERGKLWMLQTRVGKRTAAAAFRIATELVDEGLIDMDEALTRVTGAELARLMFPAFDTSAGVTKIATGVSASPGAAVGQAVFDSARAAELADAGRGGHPGPPRDQPGRPERHDRRQGRADQPRRQDQPRGRGRPRHGQDLRLRRRAARRGHRGQEVHRAGGITVAEGDVISIDGTSGEVYLGEVPVVPSPVVRYFEGELSPDSSEADELVRAVHRIMTHADARRRLGVLANADNGADAARARRFGAEGIGLVRTEHMFLGERRQLIEDLILAETDDDRAARACRPRDAADRRLRGDPRRPWTACR